MPAAKKKSKMISIRLSAEEYDSLRAMFPTMGVRTISEFARGAMQRLLPGASHGTNNGSEVDLTLRALNTKVDRLEGEVAQLYRLVARNLSAGSPD